MEKLIEKINKRIANLKDESIDPFYQSCMEYFNKENVKPYDKLRGDFRAVYMYLLLVLELGLEESERIRKLIDNCALFFCNNRYGDKFYDDYYDFLELLYEHDKLYLLNEEEYADEENDIKEALSNFKIYNDLLIKNIFFIDKEEIEDELVEEWLFNRFISQDIDPIGSIIELFKLCPKKELFKQFLEINNILDFYSGVKDDDLYEIAIKCFSKNRLSKNMNSFVDKLIKEKKYKINDNKMRINKYHMSLIKNIKNKNTINNKIRNNYKNVILFLKRNKNYIDNIDKYLEMIEDEEILYDFLKLIIKHNSTYNKNIELENIKLKKMQVSSLELLFSKYNFDFKKIDECEKTKFQNTENLEEKFKLLNVSSLNFIDTESKLFVPLITNFSINQISFIDNLYKNEIIDEIFLNDNIIDLSNKILFCNFESNIEFLKNVGLDRISRYNKTIFLEDNALISKRYKLFSDVYKIPVDNIHNFEFLENDYIFDMLDSFIELGYINQIILNPDYLVSKNILMIKRLEIAKLINMSTVNSDNSFVGSIVSGNNFYVKDDMLDEFLIDYKDLYLDTSKLDNVSRLDILTDYPDILNDYEEDYYTYKINDIKLSRNRILRNLTASKSYFGDDLFNCILYGAVNLTSEEILEISKICGHKSKVK